MISETDSAGAPATKLEVVDSSCVEKLCEGARETLGALLEAEQVQELEDDLAMIDALGPAGGGLALLEATVQEAAAVLLGQRLVEKLQLEWVQDPDTEERGVRYPNSDFVFFPRLMVQSQVAHSHRQGTLERLTLSWLVASTRDYLKNLVRFHPTQKRSTTVSS